MCACAFFSRVRCRVIVLSCCRVPSLYVSLSCHAAPPFCCALFIGQKMDIKRATCFVSVSAKSVGEKVRYSYTSASSAAFYFLLSRDREGGRENFVM